MGAVARRFVVVVIAVASGIALPVGPVGATDGFESGACVLDMTASVSGHTLSLQTAEAGPCVTSEGIGVGGFGASLPGLSGFDCETGFVKGASIDGDGGLTVSVDDDIILGMTNLLVVGEADAASLTVAFEGQNGNRVVAGTGTFALIPDSDPPCSSTSPVTTWTGVLTFADPTLPE